ncbi:DolP-mannose mannosyltransferase [Natronococcus sp. JC468]|nr:DolP-mannose mannosyltransferase [Natronococcus sp. JC468]
MSPRRSPLARALASSPPAWAIALAPVVAVVFVFGALASVRTEWSALATDPAFFQHTGWYVLQGGIPYVDVWDVNPPVPFGITAVLAALSGGDMLVLHALSVGLTTLVAAASVFLVGWIASLVTDSDAAAVAAGLAMLAVPELFTLPFQGVRAQFYALFFGACALALALRDRPFVAGAAAALSAGSWQSGAVFALLVVGIAYQRTGAKSALRTVAGGGVVTAGVVLAFAAAGALAPMVVQTILAPLLAGSPYTLTERVSSVLLVFGYGSLLLPVALYSWVRGTVRDPGGQWWIPVGGLLFGFQVLFVDMDGSTDALQLLAFVALGVAIAVESAIERRSTPADRGETARLDGRRIALAAIVVAGLFVPLGLAWNVGSPPPRATLERVETEAEPDVEPLSVTPDDADVPSMQTIYWEQLEPETCHYRVSWNEVRWVSMTDDRLDRRHCDAWPERIDRQ